MSTTLTTVSNTSGGPSPASEAAFTVTASRRCDNARTPADPRVLASLYTLSELKAAIHVLAPLDADASQPVLPPRVHGHGHSGPAPIVPSDSRPAAGDSLHGARVSPPSTRDSHDNPPVVERVMPDAQPASANPPTFVTLVSEHGTVLDAFRDGEGAQIGIDADGQVVDVDVDHNATTDDVVLLSPARSSDSIAPSDGLPSVPSSPRPDSHNDAAPAPTQPPSPAATPAPAAADTVADSPYLIHVHYPAALAYAVHFPPCRALYYLLSGTYVEWEDVRRTWWLPHAAILAIEFFSEEPMWSLADALHVLQPMGLRAYVVLDV